MTDTLFRNHLDIMAKGSNFIRRQEGKEKEMSISEIKKRGQIYLLFENMGNENEW